MPFFGDLPIAERATPWDQIIALGRIRDWAGAEDDGLEDPEVQEFLAQWGNEMKGNLEEKADDYAAFIQILALERR